MGFAENLYDMMKLRCITTVELARGSGISRNAVYQMIKGKHRCTNLAVTKRLAKELGCTPGWLLRK